MGWVFFGTECRRAVQSQNFGTEVEMLGLFSGSLGLCLKIGFGARTNVFEFCCVFWCLGFWPNLEVVTWTEPGLVQGL